MAENNPSKFVESTHPISKKTRVKQPTAHGGEIYLQYLQSRNFQVVFYADKYNTRW